MNHIKTHLAPSLMAITCLFLAACTKTDHLDGYNAPHGELQLTSAQVRTAEAHTRANLTHKGGFIWVEAYGKTAEYELSNDGNLNFWDGQPLSIPRTHTHAQNVAAYGFVSYINGNRRYSLPIHAVPANYSVSWNTTDPEAHKATLSDAIALLPAVAALNITLEDANGASLTDFIITAKNIYTCADPTFAENWQKDDTGTYQIQPTTTEAIGSEETDIYAVPTALTSGASMLVITKGGNESQSWTAAVPAGLTRLQPGKRYNLTVTLNGPQAIVTYSQITDWVQGDARYEPKGYTHAVYNWDDLVTALEAAEQTYYTKIIQMADITQLDNSQPRPVRDFREHCVFNGNGHRITGLTHPLFSTVYGGYVYNTHLRDCRMQTFAGAIGLLAFVNLSGTITQCSATGTVEHTSYGNAGGLVGNNDGYITRSYTDVQVKVTNASLLQNVGGLAGENKGQIIACAAFGTVEVDEMNANASAGTLAGYNNNNGTIAYCYATAGGEAIGDGNTDVQTSGNAKTYTLIATATGIVKEERTFNSNTGSWWTGAPDYFIDFKYEGMPN